MISMCTPFDDVMTRSAGVRKAAEGHKGDVVYRVYVTRKHGDEF